MDVCESATSQEARRTFERDLIAWEGLEAMNLDSLGAAKVFDAHTHVGRWGTNNLYGVPITPFSPEFDSYESYMEHYFNRYGVDYSVVVPHYTPDPHCPFVEFNPLVLSVVSRSSNIIGGLWVSPLPELEPLNSEALDQSTSAGIRVLKMSADAWGEYSLDPSSWSERVRRNMDKIVATAHDNNMVMQIHSGVNRSDIDRMEQYLRVYGRDVTIQVVHMGGNAGGHFKLVPKFFDWLEAGYDVYTDTSWSRGFGPRWFIREFALRGIPIKRLLMASDEPWGDLPSEVVKVLNLDCGSDVKHDILYANAYRLYCQPAEGAGA